MANVFFKKGLLANLPESYSAGTFYVTTDERAMYLDIDDSTRIRLGDFIQVAAVENLPTAGASTSALYYCVKENILAKWNGSDWTQINKQPTAEEMKTLLGLGSLAYKSEVVEDDLNADLVAKINASAEGNHSHANSDVLGGITSDKVTAWDNAEKNAKDYADGLNTAMNTRVEALEAIDHTHDNKELLDSYTQTEANLADAVAKKHSHTFDETVLNGITAAKVADWDDAVSKEHTHTFVDTDVEDAISKKHSHTFVESELNKIVAGDVAKWNGVVADHLTAADKTAIEDSIGDVNTALENYKTSNNEALAGVKATADAAATKTYVDEELAKKVNKTDYEADKATFATKTEVETEFAKYNTTVAQKAIDDAQDAEIAKKVDKVEGKSLIADTEITRLAGMSDGANKVENVGGGKIKIDGEEVTVYAHPDKHAIADVDGLETALAGLQAKGDYAAEEHTHTKSEITDFAHTHVAADITDLDDTIKGYDYATKDEAKGYADAKDEAIAAALKAGTDAQGEVDALETYVGTFTASEGVDTVVKYIDAKTANIASDERVNGIDNRVKAIEDDYLVEADKTELSNAIATEKSRAEGIEGGLRTDIDAVKADYLKGSDKTELEGKITAEENRAKGVESGLDTRVKAIEDDYLKAADKTELEGKITANANAITALTDGIDPEKIDGLTDLVNWANTHAPEVEGIKTDIEANTKAIGDETTRATGAEEALSGRIDELKASYDEHTHSWNDLTDKPFYEEAGELLEVCCDAVIPAEDLIPYGDPVYDYYLPEDKQPEGGFYVGDYTYEVIIDGVAYRLQASNDRYPRLGDSTYETYPFCFFSTNGRVSMNFNTPGPHTVKITAYQGASTVVQLDEKFIPDTIARTETVTALAGRLATLEAIDHDAYVEADDVLKSEIQGEIAALKTEVGNQDAVVLAEAQKYSDTAKAEAIADAEGKVNALAGNVFTKAEAEALFTWGEF